jgi:hypothetical protein
MSCSIRPVALQGCYRGVTRVVWGSCNGISMALLWCYYGVVLLRCYYGVTMVLLWCYTGEQLMSCSIRPVVLQGCYRGVTRVVWGSWNGVSMVLLWYYYGVTMVLLWCYYGVTMVLLSCYYGVTQESSSGL